MHDGAVGAVDNLRVSAVIQEVVTIEEASKCAMKTKGAEAQVFLMDYMDSVSWAP